MLFIKRKQLRMVQPLMLLLHLIKPSCLLVQQIEEVELFLKAVKVMKIKKKDEKEESLLKKGENSSTIDVSDLPRGTYYLHLTYSDNKVDKTRIILN